MPQLKRLNMVRAARAGMLAKLRESITLRLILIPFVLLNVKFLVAGLSIEGYTFPAMTAGEFGIAITAVMTIWLGREWTEKVSKRKSDVDVG